MANLADQTSAQMRSDVRDPDGGGNTQCHTHCGSSIDTRSDTSKIETYIEEEGGHAPDGEGTQVESQLAPNDDGTTPRDRSCPRWGHYLEKIRAVAPVGAWILITGCETTSRARPEGRLTLRTAGGSVAWFCIGRISAGSFPFSSGLLRLVAFLPGIYRPGI